MASNKPILHVQNLSSGYGSVQVLWDIDIEVHDEEAVCIIGSNGAGKSTLMQSLIGAQPVWDGTILYEGEDITHAKSSERVRKRIALVPEGRQLFYAITVEDNLRRLLPGHAHPAPCLRPHLALRRDYKISV